MPTLRNIRQRHGFAGLWPRRDVDGLWPRVTWLWWTWDLLPAPIGRRVASILFDLRRRS